MKRIEKIKSMTVEELADAIMEQNIDENINFCKSKEECWEEFEIPKEECRKCLIEWLEGEEDV